LTLLNPPPGAWGSFVAKADVFMTKTEEHALQGVNPGGYYQAIWCRDASYILRDWNLSGGMTADLQQLYLIWSHQIDPGREKLVYGRGSPEMKFTSHVPPLYEINDSTCQGSYYSCGILPYKIEQSQDNVAATLRSMYLLLHFTEA
jgi:hypothetical protein